MDESMIERLRKSKAARDNAATQEGQADGERWAAETAEYDELKRLHEFATDVMDGGRGSFQDWFEMEANAPYDHAGWIAERILGDGARAEEMFGGRQGDAAYVYGFTAAALMAYRRVEDKL
jgi:hypothetical protein